uniref:Bm14353 n=1 Tax=Brugia malayi TaxID=6279 RepID=A0A0J9Y439_BRUMA|nr:Bm14353 [Brugia malayi]
MSSTSSGSVSSRRKQAKPQRLSHESDLYSDSTVTNGKKE